MGCPKLHEGWRFVSAETARYAYSPYGALAKSSGPDADENPFLFSSEYLDSETNLVYYNYRYYSPELGRWTKRDPIEEDGGFNLYGMVSNGVTNRWDSLGLEEAKEKPDCCVTGNPVFKASGKLDKNLKPDDFIKINPKTGAKASWGVAEPGKLGPERDPYTGHVRQKVFMSVTYAGKQNCSVTQTMALENWNIPFVSEHMKFLALDPKFDPDKFVKNPKAPYPEPGLNPENPKNSSWGPKYDSKKINFYDAMSANTGSVGKIRFTTCFISKNSTSKIKQCCFVWTWLVVLDTGYRTESYRNEAQLISSKCE